MRRNPRVRKHPDFFSAEDTDMRVPLSQMTRREIAKLPFDAFSKEELEELEDSDYELYSQIVSKSEEAREEAITNLVSYLKDGMKWQVEYEAEGEGVEAYVDAFQRWLEYEADFGELVDHVEEQIGDQLDGYSEEALEPILRDPYIWEVKGAADQDPYYRPPDAVWNAFNDEIEDQLDGRKWNRDLDDLVRALEPFLVLPDTIKELDDALQREDLYTDAKSLLEDGSVYITYPANIVYTAELNVDELNDRLAELAKGEKRLKRDTSEQKVVYTFSDGDYVADLRSDQLHTEGRMQRHCVGRPGMGYGRRINDGEIKIYSLRTPNAKAQLTFEVSLDPSGRPTGVPQVKGFSNRLPGFTEARHGSVEKIAEVQKAAEFIREHLGLDPYDARDLRPALEVVEGARRLRANPGLPVPRNLQRLAERRYERPWGGRWGE